MIGYSFITVQHLSVIEAVQYFSNSLENGNIFGGRCKKLNGTIATFRDVGSNFLRISSWVGIEYTGQNPIGTKPGHS